MKAFRSQLVHSIANTGSSVFSRSILPTSLAEFGRRVMTLMPQHSQRERTSLPIKESAFSVTSRRGAT